MNQFWDQGFAVANNVYSRDEVNEMVALIESKRSKSSNHRIQKEVFAIRNFLNEYPELTGPLWNDNLVELVNQTGDSSYENVKSIYFDKPPSSNWVVGWHQDTTISVNEQLDIPGYKNWTFKNGLAAVQPPLDKLKWNFTLRIHLDDCDSKNGALNVVPQSHKCGILNTAKLKEIIENESPRCCSVKSGGVMLMHPLTLHSSRRSENDLNRRVIHLEFSKESLPGKLQWRELNLINRQKGLFASHQQPVDR